MTHRFLRALALAASVLGASTLCAAQTFPQKPVRVVLPYSAGSGPDAVVRQVGEKLGQAWGQQVIVDNKPGSNGWISTGEVKRAAPDGHTLLTVDATHMTLQPTLYKTLPFDPVKDFEPVAPLYHTNFFVVVGANAPWKTMTELLADAKAKGGRMTYGTWGYGSVAHVGAAMLESATGTQMTHVPFKELPLLYTSVANGEVDWAFGTAATVAPLVQAKKVRLLAYAAPARMAGHDAVPTMGEAGGPAGFELGTWVALYAPKGTPRPVIERINAAVNKALGEPDVKGRLAGFGFQPWAAPSADITRSADADTRRYGAIVRQASISLD
jgi:tripartite-type tricarboxylate transporter receptor subunit TctC